MIALSVVQDIRENALNWLMLEVLPKKRFGGYRWRAVDPWNEM